MNSRKPRKQISTEVAKLRLADLCSRSEQCESDLQRKLYAWGIGRRDAESIIAELYEHSFIDERRYARALARDKVRFSAWGPRKVRLALMQKRIPADAIDYALGEVEPTDYQDALRRAAASKARSLNLDEDSDRSALYRHLLARGFYSEAAVKEIERLRRFS